MNNKVRIMKLSFKILGGLLFFAFLSACLFSCAKLDLRSFDPETPVISFDKESITLGNFGDTIEVAISSNLPWRLKSSSSWVSFPKSNGQGDETIKIAVSRNRVEEIRKAEITAYITDDAYATLTLEQLAGDPAPDFSTHYYVTAEAKGGSGGKSWDDPIDFEQALELVASGDVIHLAAGTYTPSKTVTGGDANNARDRSFEINENIHIIGGYPENPVEGSVSNPAVNQTVLSGKLNDSYHVVVVVAPQSEEHQVVIEGVTITGGKAHSANSNVSIDGVNVNRGYGGGMIIVGSKVKIDNSQIIDNATENHAAGMYITRQAVVEITGSSISKNKGLVNTTNGGGIWNDGSTLIMQDSEVNENRIGGVGGGLYSLHSSLTSYNYLYNVTIANNAVGTEGALTRVGAGIYAREKSKFVLVNSTIYGNDNGGSGFGAGLTAYGEASVDLISCTISGNKGGVGNTGANGGSGVFNNPSHNNTVNIYNSIVSGNIGYDKDIGGGEITAKSSVVGDGVFDYEGSLVSGAAFDFKESLGGFENYGGFGSSIPVLKLDGPAADYSMTMLQLQILSSNIEVDIKRLLEDQNHKDREQGNVIGAALPN